VEPRLARPDDPSLEAGACDRVLIVDTWHHVADRAAYASKLARALRPGGLVVVVDFKRDAHHGPPPHHRLAPEDVVRELEAGGLAARMVDDLPEQYIVVARASGAR
jgi:SAM-dependent methyltransferase